MTAHTRLKEKFKSGMKSLDYDVSKGFYEPERFFKKESDALLEKWVVKKEIDAEGMRSLTLPGAIALTYRSIPPGRNIWRFITEKRTRAAIKNV